MTPGASAVVGRSRKISWDVVRVACVLLVVLYHASFIGPIVLYPELVTRPVTFSYQVGASLLLLVSAYFACMSLGRGDTVRYWVSRVGRVLPAFLLAAVLAFAVLRYTAPPEWFTPQPRDLVANWLMLWHWKPQHYPYLDGSYWTVPLQLMAFTTAAVLWCTRWGHGTRLRVLLWAVALIPLAQWPLRILGPPETYRMVVDGLGFQRLHLFVAGVAIWLWSTRRMRNGHATALIASCMLAHALHNHVLTDSGLVADWGSTIGVWIGIGVVALAAGGPDWDRLIPTSWFPAVRWLAGISYGMFLIHQTVGFVLMRRLQDLGVGPTLQTAAMLVTAVLLGWALSRIVERPAHRALLRWHDALRPHST
ncbi:MAG: acyltransferase family protein [Pseudonocardiaceae bacterium]|nr:acyltransferase family protein [Pseudonocardiaceae bacterium]